MINLLRSTLKPFYFHMVLIVIFLILEYEVVIFVDVDTNWEFLQLRGETSWFRQEQWYGISNEFIPREI